MMDNCPECGTTIGFAHSDDCSKRAEQFRGEVLDTIVVHIPGSALHREYIVKCVNSHEALVESLKECGEQIELMANAMSIPTESSSPRADGDDNGCRGVLIRARAALTAAGEM